MTTALLTATSAQMVVPMITAQGDVPMTTICHMTMPTTYGNCIGRHCGPQNLWPSDIGSSCETVPVTATTKHGEVKRTLEAGQEL